MCISALIAAGGAIGGGLLAKSGAEKSGQVVSDAANRSADLQMEQYRQTREDLTPWREAGQRALGIITPGLTGGVPERNAFLNYFQASPDYQFRLGEGTRALDRSAASRGMLLSGAQTKAVQNYGQNLASGEYGNWFNRLSSLAGTGQTATNNTGQFGAAAAAGAGNSLAQGGIAAGQARATGYNNLASGIGAGINNMLFANFMGGGRGAANGFNPWGADINPYG